MELNSNNNISKSIRKVRTDHPAKHEIKCAVLVWFNILVLLC